MIIFIDEDTISREDLNEEVRREDTGEEEDYEAYEHEHEGVQEAAGR